MMTIGAALTLFTTLAQTLPAASTSQPAPGWVQFTQSLPFVMIVVMVMLLMFGNRNKRRDQKKVQSMLDNLKKGDRIQTIGGILGTVVEARENEVLVKVDETNNTKLRFSRKAIHRVIEDEAPGTTTAADKK